MKPSTRLYGPSGPCADWDMPKDVQEAVFTSDFDREMDIPGYNPVLPVLRISSCTG